jgi:hypothetical protein
MQLLGGILIGFGIAVFIAGFILFCVGKVGNNEVPIYRNGCVWIGRKYYSIIGEHPFHNMERVEGRFEIRKDSKGFQFAVYKP